MTDTGAVPCARGCGREGLGARFVHDVRMRGVLVRVAVANPPWFVCGPCQERFGEQLCCLRCGGGVHLPIGEELRCARCGLVAGTRLPA